MPIGSMTETKNFCKFHVRNPRPYKSFRVITLSERKRIKATIGSKSKRPYARSSKIINVMGDKTFYKCSDFFPIAKRIARKSKVM